MELHENKSPHTQGLRKPEVQPRRILLVDDSADNREVLAQFLELQGHAVLTANDGLAGLSAAREFHPEIVFVDLTMPRMDGFELCEHLRASALTQNAAVFALSASAYPSDRRSVGFDAYLRKPVEFEVIEAIIRCTARTLRN